MKPVSRRELNEVHFLRGTASLMVCLYHLILGNQELFPSSNLIERTFSFGYLGVEVFFILSGYVICYAFPIDFSYHDLRTFFLKRIVRIEPPYIVSIILIIALNFVSHKITGLPNELDFLGIISHLAYINNFYPGTYLNVVYWTLGIEFQFYFLIAFLFPLMEVSKYFFLLVSVLFVFISCLHIPFAVDIIIPFLSYFTLGILLFFYKIRKQISLSLFVTIALASCIQIFIFQGPAGFIAALTTILILLFWTYANGAIRFFSLISYSLYLIHVPVGGKVINLGMRYTNSDLSKYALVLLALIICVTFAYVFYKFIELPALKLSKRIIYKRSVKNSVQHGELDTDLKNKVLV